MKFTPLPDCQVKGLGGIYAQYFDPGIPGRFVEVGAFDGRHYSNTCFLADLGWTGVYIEAHPDFAKVCARNYKYNPKITVISSAVGSASHTADLWIAGACSSLSRQSALEWQGGAESVKVQVQTLDKILNEIGWKPGFEVLVVDVEEAELSVLHGFSLREWLPKMAIIETHEKDTAPQRNWKAKPIRKIFEDAGYRSIYVDAINTIYVR